MSKHTRPGVHVPLLILHLCGGHWQVMIVFKVTCLHGLSMGDYVFWSGLWHLGNPKGSPLILILICHRQYHSSSPMAPETARVLQDKCRFLGPIQTSSPWNLAQESVGVHYACACARMQTYGRTNDLNFPSCLGVEDYEHQVSSLEIPKEITLRQKCLVIATLGQS